MDCRKHRSLFIETASRIIHLTERGIEIIQEQERLNAEAGFTNPHLFLTAFGGEYRWLNKLREDYWQPTLKALGIRERVAYKVRHTYASHRLMAGCLPAQASHDMGHADLSMLFTVYGEYVNHGQSEAEMRKFEEYMEGVRGMPAARQGPAMQVLQAQLDMAKQTIETQRQQLEMMQQMTIQQQQLMLMQKDILPGEEKPEYCQNIGQTTQKKNPTP